jgi:ribonuclease VapC
MIVVDSSALIAIIEQEPEAERFSKIIRDSSRRLVSAVTIYETGIVVGVRRGFEAVNDAIALVTELHLDGVPFAEPHVSDALKAYSRFGKGVHPRARLNLGDCVSYALAKRLDAPLLFKGLDFTHTDIRACA